MTDRYDIEASAETMWAVVTTGNGGYEKLKYRQVPRPCLAQGEVLINVLAAGVNNTEINTRLGWYSESVSTGTADIADSEPDKTGNKSDGGWNQVTPFPFIQGTDCCGRVVDVFNGDDDSLIGSRVLVRSCMRSSGFGSIDNIWMASDFDGAFAQYVKVPATEVFAVNCDWTDAELATIPCAYGTAENMIQRAKISEVDTVLVAGSSGGVGSAAVQLGKRRGATIIAIAGRSKIERVKAIGADLVLPRGDDLARALGTESVDVVIDNVAGDRFGEMLKVLKRGGRYTSSGAIAGPIVSLDMRDFYLKDVTMFGCTAWDEPVFANLIDYIEREEIIPLLQKQFPLENIVDAQKEFLKKSHVGNYALIPPPL